MNVDIKTKGKSLFLSLISRKHLIQSGMKYYTYNLLTMEKGGILWFDELNGSQFAVKIGNQRTEFSHRGRGCSLSPALFSIYINRLANTLEHALIQGLTSYKVTWFSCQPLKRGSGQICWIITNHKNTHLPWIKNNFNR